MADTGRNRRAGYPVRKTTLQGQDHDRDLENTTAAERLGTGRNDRQGGRWRWMPGPSWENRLLNPDFRDIQPPED